MGNISVDSISVTNTLELFKSEMLKLDALVSELNTDTKGIKVTWRGRASDEALTRIDSFNYTFDSIKNKNKDFINFVDSTIAKYKALDESERQFVEQRVNDFDTSFYGN